VNSKERQALREKHEPLNYGDGVPPQCLGCDDNCIEGDGIDWPCDVIKVLDAYDKLVADCKQLVEDLPQETVVQYWVDYVKDKW